jgi:hypothetical protein
MRTKLFQKKLVSIGVAAVLAATAVGCFDLGEFSDEEAYYDAFGDVQLVYQNPSATKKDVESEDYSIKDYFYNKNTGEDFTYGDPKDEEPDEGKDIPQLPYVYMAIPVEQDMKVESLALYFNALGTCALDISFYVVDELPDGGDFTNVRIFGEPEYRQVFDDDGNPLYENNEPVYEKIKYSDPDDSLLVGKTNTHLKEGGWVACVMENWSSGDVVEIKESQYLLLRFVNNCAADTDTISVAFRVTNLLIRTVS